jgi:hypothetical protein
VPERTRGYVEGFTRCCTLGDLVTAEEYLRLINQALDNAEKGRL